MKVETALRRVLMGPVNSRDKSSVTSLFLSMSKTIDENIKQFWLLEELTSVHHLTSNDIAAESFYTTTTTRLKTGRFMVRLPFRQSRLLLGDSRAVALHKFKALEMRLSRNEEIGQQYIDFMFDYKSADHKELVPMHNRSTTH